MNEIKTQLVETYQNVVESVVQMGPKLLTGIVLAVVALLVAKFVERVLRTLLTRLKLDDLVGRAGLDQTLQKLGLTRSLNFFVPRVAYFLLLFLFAQAAAQSMGLEPVSRAIGSFLGYLPNLVAALLLLIVGSAVGQFVGGMVTRAAREADLDFARPLGTLVSALILFLAGIMALTQLKMHTEIIRIVTVCLLAGFALAFGLSFGLGSREVTRNLMAGYYARKLFRIGEQLEVRGEQGVLTAITPTQAQLERDGRTITVCNTALLDETVRQP